LEFPECIEGKVWSATKHEGLYHVSNGETDIKWLEWALTLSPVAVVSDESCTSPKQLGPLKGGELIEKGVLYLELLCKGFSSSPDEVLVLV